MFEKLKEKIKERWQLEKLASRIERSRKKLKKLTKNIPNEALNETSNSIPDPHEFAIKIKKMRRNRLYSKLPLVLIRTLLIITGIVLGFYLGGYICFYGGIVGIISQLKLLGTAAAVSIDAGIVAWCIVKIIFAGVVGSMTITFFMLLNKAFSE